MTAPSRPPSDVRIAFPPGWYGVDLDPEATPASVHRLVERQFRGQDDMPHVKALVRDALLDSAQRARDIGGVRLWLSVDPVGGVPLSASLLVSSVPGSALGPSPGDESLVLDELLRRRRETALEADAVELELGRAVRVRRSEDPMAMLTGAPTAQDAPVRSATVLEFVVQVPGSTGCLVLTFSTPDLAPDMTAALLELFDVMAATARWVP